MQIHEITTRPITEGVWSDLGRSMVSKVMPQSQASINKDAADAAAKLRAQGYGATQAQNPTTIKRIVVSLVDPGQDIPSNYYKVGTMWTNETGNVITNPKSKAWLDSKIATHGKTEYVPATPAPAPTIKKVSRRRGVR